MLTALSVPIVKLIGLQGTLLRLKSHLPTAPIFFFRLPQGDAAKKRKKRGATGQNMFYPSKEQKGYFWSYENRPLGQTKNTSDISGYIARVYS